LFPPDYFVLSSTIFFSILRQPVKLIDQGVYLPVGGLDLPLEGDLVMGGAGLLELLVKGEHSLHQGDQRIVAGDVGGIGAIS
jgi:hypothetical protein